MVQRYIAALLILTLLVLATPVWAGDYVNPKFLPPKATYSRLARNFALAMPQSGQQSPPAGQAQQSQPGSKRSLTTTGKVLKWVGIGLMAEGALTIGLGEAVYKGNGCAASYSGSCGLDNSDARNIYRGVGGASIGTGLVLLLVGLSKKQ